MAAADGESVGVGACAQPNPVRLIQDGYRVRAVLVRVAARKERRDGKEDHGNDDAFYDEPSVDKLARALRWTQRQKPRARRKRRIRQTSFDVDVLWLVKLARDAQLHGR